MQEITIRLPDETVNYLQRMDYELGGLQVLHTHALNAGTPLEKRMEIKREFQETFAEYQMAKNEMWAEFAPKHPNTKRWWVDFQTGELHVVCFVGAGHPARPGEREACEMDQRAGQCPAPTGAAEVGSHA